MKINEAGLKIIKDSEGCKLKSYRCPAGVLTIGYGHTGSDVYETQEITQAQADELLAKDVARFESAVHKFCQVPLTPNQFSALVSFAYNVGGWRSSTLFRHIRDQKYGDAAQEFPKWCHAGGKVLKGLLIRREAEKTLFLKP